MSKSLFSVVFLITCAAILNFGCGGKSEANRNTARNAATNENQNPANQVQTNQNPAGNANQTPSIEEEMSHTEMQSSADAKNAPFDLQFLDTMIAHHQGAVVMAKPAVDKAEHLEIKDLARNISSSQEKEIAQMREWREKWYPNKPLAMNMEMPGMADSMRDMDMKKLEAQTGTAFDLAFMEMMIPHHQGAIAMAKEAIEKAEHPEIKTLAKAIIMAQEAEINSMNDWKTKWTSR